MDLWMLAPKSDLDSVGVDDTSVGLYGLPMVKTISEFLLVFKWLGDEDDVWTSD